MSYDPTETIRRARVAEINSRPGDRQILETRYPKVWTTAELRAEFEVLGFMAPLVGVRRLADQKMGSLEFQDHPRFYFNWKEHDPS